MSKISARHLAVGQKIDNGIVETVLSIELVENPWADNELKAGLYGNDSNYPLQFKYLGEDDKGWVRAAYLIDDATGYEVVN
jgi:hypothetical protein